MLPKISSINSSPVMKMRWKHSRGKQCKDTSIGTLKGLQEKPLVWVCSSGLKRETESLIILAKHQARNTHYHQRNIIKQPTDSKCRICCKAEKHIKHTVVGCTTLVPSEYTNGHSKVAGYMHWMVCEHMELQVADIWKSHKCQKYHYYVGCTGYQISNNTSKRIWYTTVW
jgi:hypothetical protein